MKTRSSTSLSSAADPQARRRRMISRGAAAKSRSSTRPAASSPAAAPFRPRLIRDFGIPDHLLKARVTSARMISPKGVAVDMPIKGGFVGMVDRCEFDEWLRCRAPPHRRDARDGRL